MRGRLGERAEKLHPALLGLSRVRRYKNYGVTLVGKRFALRKAKGYGGAVKYACWSVQRIFMGRVDGGKVTWGPGAASFSL